jgi:outer membrane protein W
MIRRAALVFCIALIALIVPAASARAQQTVNFTIGGFNIHGADARTTGDVLVSDQRYLTFNIDDFHTVTFGGEWLVPFGRFFEGGAGVSYFSHSVPSAYSDFTEPGGGPISQQLKLRMVPISFTVRALPLTNRSPVQPYIGGGLAVINWRYSESGEFVDFANRNTIFTDSFVGTGNATGGVVLGGVRFAGDRATGGFEVRYQHASADLPVSEFASSANPNPKIDLGGWTYQATIGVRFGR